MLRVEVGTFLIAVALGDLELKCFGRHLDLLPDGIFWNRANDITKGRHWSWQEVGEQLRFWR